MDEFVVVTGAATGIGYDACRYLISKGYSVFGSVRKAGDGSRLQEEFGEKFTPLLFDVTDYDAIAVAAEQVSQRIDGAGLFGLVNNAGIAVAGPLLNMPIDDFKWQFEVNVFGLLAVSQAFIPLLKSDGPSGRPGRIVNISSASGQFSLPFFGPYSGSKYAVEAISDAFRRELMIYGIDVIVIGPSAVKTPIWDKVGGIDPEMLKQTDYADQLEMLDVFTREGNENGMPVERVSETIHTALTHSTPKARYGLYNDLTERISRFLPARLVDQQIAKMFKLSK